MESYFLTVTYTTGATSVTEASYSSGASGPSLVFKSPCYQGLYITNVATSQKIAHQPSSLRC